MMRKAALVCVVLILLAVPSVAHAAVVFVNLGTAAPPTTMGGYVMTPFNIAPQAAIADGTSVTAIPGVPPPFAGSLTLSTALDKHTVPGGGWSTWSHGYTGPVFGTYSPLTTDTITLPAGVGAFYLYVEPDTFATFAITVTTNFGGTSGSVNVNGASGANGFGFYTVTPGETIQTVTVNAPTAANGFAIAEFGIAGFSVPALPAPFFLLMVAILMTLAMVSLRRRGRLA